MLVTYTDKIRDIAITAFEVTCYMFPLEEWEIEDAEDLDQMKDDVRAVVRFDGAAQGAMAIKPSRELYASIAANMLGKETPNDAEKAGALCEITNIICGNTVPLFARNKKICTLRPPVIAGTDENLEELFKEMVSESLIIHLDGGIAEITIYYSAGGDL